VAGEPVVEAVAAVAAAGAATQALLRGPLQPARQRRAVGATELTADYPWTGVAPRLGAGIPIAAGSRCEATGQSICVLQFV